NRFQVVKGRETEFEEVWKSRDSHLDQVEGFVEFHLLRGPEADDYTLYCSHSVWASESAFEAWTKSEQFRKAHANAGQTSGMYLGPPQFEAFQVI
ncbi:MAG: antibiotic biosynthesis monooxygenase family protein, partial [Methyloligellaceae bacterium]